MTLAGLSRRDALCALAGTAMTQAARAAASRPNILFILMDDLGYPSLSCFGNRFVPTPNLDRLAKEGVRFTQAYVTPQCTPTRSTLLTGQYTARNKMWHVIPWYGYPSARVTEPPYGENLSRDAFTMAKGLKAAGYATACIGKWHLTANPDGNYIGLNPEASHHYGFDVTQTPAKIPNEHNTGDKSVTRFTEEAIAFFEANRERPWFCYLAHHSIHRAVSAPPLLVEKYRRLGYPETGINHATYLAAIEHFDAAIGRLLASLDRMGLRERTAVVFLSDNGGVYRTYLPNPPAPADREPVRLVEAPGDFSNAPLRAGKGFAYEGGLRVPMIVRWPGVTQSGATCETPVHAVDLMPTFFEMAGAKAPPNYSVDGVSLVPLFGGKRIARRALYWYMPFYDVRWLATPSAVIRDGDYKLIDYFGDFIDEDKRAEYTVGARLELYNLRNDPGETRNLAARMPDRARSMQRQLHAWIRSCGSEVPGLNPKYDPHLPLAEAHRTAPA
ncbi:MAG: sulfatase [Candidatus Solibacter sp.]|nr:sulfatase [Candidatus Solibacter sp.]